MQFLSVNRLNGRQIFGQLSFPHIPTVKACHITAAKTTHPLRTIIGTTSRRSLFNLLIASMSVDESSKSNICTVTEIHVTPHNDMSHLTTTMSHLTTTCLTPQRHVTPHLTTTCHTSQRHVTPHLTTTCHTSQRHVSPHHYITYLSSPLHISRYGIVEFNVPLNTL